MVVIVGGECQKIEWEKKKGKEIIKYTKREKEKSKSQKKFERGKEIKNYYKTRAEAAAEGEVERVKHNAKKESSNKHIKFQNRIVKTSSHNEGVSSIVNTQSMNIKETESKEASHKHKITYFPEAFMFGKITNQREKKEKEIKENLNICSTHKNTY